MEAPEPEGEGGLGENENPWGVVKEKSTNHAVNTLVMGVECQYPIYRSYDWVFVKNGERLYGFGRLITPMTTARHSAERELMDFFDNAPIAMHWCEIVYHLCIWSWISSFALISLFSLLFGSMHGLSLYP